MMHRGMLGHMRSMTTRYYLRDMCRIEAEQTSKNANFINETSWNTVATVKCRILPAGQGDMERVEEFASQESIKVLKRLVVSHDTALDVGQRVVIGSETYYIASLDVESTDKVFQAAVVVKRAGAEDDG